MDKAQTERFWKKVDQIAYGIEPVLRYFLEANGFTNFSAFLHTSFDEYLAEKMVQRVRSIKPGDKHYKNLSEWLDESLENFKLLEGWKSSLRTVFITMNSCDPAIFARHSEIIQKEQPQAKIQPQTKLQTAECIPRRAQDEADPNFLRNVTEKFQTKIHAKLQELDPELPWASGKDVPLSFVCDYDNGKKFETKCPYCPSTRVIYYRYNPVSGGAPDNKTFYPQFNDSNFFKHVSQHVSNGHASNGTRNVAVKRRAEDSLDASYSNSEDFLRSHVKIEEPEW